MDCFFWLLEVLSFGSVAVGGGDGVGFGFVVIGGIFYCWYWCWRESEFVDVAPLIFNWKN